MNPSQLLDAFLDEARSRVIDTVCESDHMVPKTGDMGRYLGVGRDALRCIGLSMAAAGCDAPQRILDFGGGAGRVARWLRAAFPDAALTVAELNEEWLSFAEATFGATPVRSSPQVETLSLPDTFDLIWAGSVLTHVSEVNARALLEKFAAALSPGGVMVVTSHGRKAIENQLLGRASYASADNFARIMSEATVAGYGFRPHREGRYGGISVTQPQWFAAMAARLDNIRLVHFMEAGWDNHQDVAALARVA